MNHTQKQIAEAFSGGNFELTYPYLSENIEWNVIGDFNLKGKQNVIEKCEETAGYFKSVTTNFKMLNIIEDKNRVVINGTAEFTKNGKLAAFVSACDVYEFNDENKLQNITSYCIVENK